MNPINRVGQKVVCIEGPSFWALSSCGDYFAAAPEQGRVYTVSGFETRYGIPCIHLREIASPACKCIGASNLPWPIRAFRPVQTRETDISVFAGILNKTNAPERIKA
jgi:hypothetical protein